VSAYEAAARHARIAIIGAAHFPAAEYTCAPAAAAAIDVA
jgi:hypothetical protein